MDIGGGETPATESSGAVQQPLQSTGGNPGFDVASLPIGGQSEGTFGDSGVQCVRVNWTLPPPGGAIPAGIAVLVTGASFAPDVFDPENAPCELAPCVGFTFKLSEVACDLPIGPRQANATGLSDSERATLTLRGLIACTDKDSATCTSFVSAVRGSPQTLTVPLPIVPGKPTPGP